MTVNQLAVLCQRLGDKDDLVCTSPEARALAESIAGRVRDGAPPAEIADALDELEESLLRAGYAAGLSPARSYERLLGTGDGHRVLEVLACPGGICARIEAPGLGSEPGPGSAPGSEHCPVQRLPLSVMRLRS